MNDNGQGISFYTDCIESNQIMELLIYRVIGFLSCENAWNFFKAFENINWKYDSIEFRISR